MVERFQFDLSASFSAQLLPQSAIFTTIAIEPATDIDRYLLLPSNCHEPNSFLAWLIRSVMSVSLSSGTK
jgi:hypothetical protein